MDIHIEAMIERSHGIVVVSQLATALEKFDLDFARHEVFGADPDHRRVRIRARGDALPIESLCETLVAIDGVCELLDVSPAPPEENPLGSGAWLEAEEDALVNQIVWDYPRVQPLVAPFQQGLAPEEREHRLTRLGVKVGTRIAPAWPELAHVQTVHDALDRIVLPALKSIAVGEAEDGELRVTNSVFVRRNLDMMYMSVENDPSKCFFLTGLILGLLRESPGLRVLRVGEEECRETGGAFCRFAVDTARDA